MVGHKHRLWRDQPKQHIGLRLFHGTAERLDTLDPKEDGAVAR